MKDIGRREFLRTGAGAGLGASLAAFGLPAVRGEQPASLEPAPRGARERIKAFCVDFNWGPGGENGFSPPGLFSNASAQEHVKWYRELGVNTIQSFCVSCIGYAWFRSSVAPVTPGMKGDFLKELADLGHEAGMRVMGYFCVGANTHWGKTRPGLSHGNPSETHIPLTLEYVDYLAKCIEDALKVTAIDGFMLDWFFSPEPRWIECEENMYEEIFGEGFPGKEAMTEARTVDFKRRAVARAWKRVREAAKSVRPECILWLSCYDLGDPQVAWSTLVREVDWLMNENPDPAKLVLASAETGKETRLIQCICGWGERHDAEKIIKDPRHADWGFYGFAKPSTATGFPPLESSDPLTAGNARNIEIIRKAFTGG